MCRGRVEYLGEQLGIADVSCVKRYTDRAMTAYQHSWQIRKAYGFRGFEGAAVSAEFRGFLDGRAWIHAEGPGALFEHGVGWLLRNRVLLPGITVLVRLVATVREAAAERMHTALAAAAAEVDPALPGRLRASLRVPAGSRFSEMESWRRAPTRVSGPGLAQALERAAALAGLAVRAADCSAVPPNRVAALARYGLVSKAPTLLALAEPRRTATLLAMSRHLDAVAIDDALDLFALLMATKLINPARRASATERLAALPRLERVPDAGRGQPRAAHRVGHCRGGGPCGGCRRGVGGDRAGCVAGADHRGGRHGRGAGARRRRLGGGGDAGAAGRAVRPFLGLLAESGTLRAASGGRGGAGRGQDVAGAGGAEGAAQAAATRRDRLAAGAGDVAPRGVHQPGAARGCGGPRRLRRVRARAAAPHAAGPRCVRGASHRWGDPRARLLDGPAWEAVRPETLDGLGLPASAEEHLRAQVTLLDAAWAQLAARLAEAGDNASVRIVPGAGDRMRLSVEHLDALEVPASLVELRALTAAMLPHIDLPELLLEVHA